MPQFALHRNRNPATRARFPLLLDVQSDLLDALATRVVVPLSPLGAARPRSMERLTPVIRHDGKEYLMLTPQLAGIAARELGPIVGDASTQRTDIVAAVDFLLAGV